MIFNYITINSPEYINNPYLTGPNSMHKAIKATLSLTICKLTFLEYCEILKKILSV